MSKKTLASVARFAHLLGMNPKSEAPETEDNDDPKKQRPDESDEDYAKRMEEEEKKDEAKTAEGDDDGADAAADDEGEAGDDDDETSDKEKAARKAERARCAAIFACKAAASRPDMAAHLAFQTGMSASAAIDMLSAFAAGAPGKVTLSSRMASVVVPVVGADAGAAPVPANSAKAIADRIIAAGQKARGEKA